MTWSNVSNWLLLAQEAKPDEAPLPTAGLGNMLFPLAAIMVLFYFLILRPQRSKDQQFRSMVDNLKETDRVVTIGGIHGVVTNVQRDTSVITLRIDESTGAKIRVNASAIAKIVTDETPA